MPKGNAVRPHQEKVVLVGLHISGVTDKEFEYSLSELHRLVDTAGGLVVNTFIQNKHQPDPASYLGSGKLAELRAYLSDNTEIETVVFDNDLNPRQISSLTETLNVKVIDRTELILDIFAKGARTREAQLEVELAQLEYLFPRLTHLWSHLSRLGGGIGTRGPGETQLELDRRIVNNRINILKRRIKEVSANRDLHRKGRQRKGFKVVAIVGYTNAGKSTLLTAISKQTVYVKDKLFATLDPVIRKVFIPALQAEVLFSDTVGFIQNLPHHLVDSFKSTLEEVAYADLIIHVVDLSAEDMLRQIDTVYTVLEDLNSLDKKILTVFNKSDLAITTLDPNILQAHAPAIVVSALKKDGLDNFLTQVAELLK